MNSIKSLLLLGLFRHYALCGQRTDDTAAILFSANFADGSCPLCWAPKSRLVVKGAWDPVT